MSNLLHVVNVRPVLPKSQNTNAVFEASEYDYYLECTVFADLGAHLPTKLRRGAKGKVVLFHSNNAHQSSFDLIMEDVNAYLDTLSPEERDKVWKPMKVADIPAGTKKLVLKDTMIHGYISNYQYPEGQYSESIFEGKAKKHTSMALPCIGSQGENGIGAWGETPRQRFQNLVDAGLVEIKYDTVAQAPDEDL